MKPRKPAWYTRRTIIRKLHSLCCLSSHCIKLVLGARLGVHLLLFFWEKCHHALLRPRLLWLFLRHLLVLIYEWVFEVKVTRRFKAVGYKLSICAKSYLVTSASLNMKYSVAMHRLRHQWLLPTRFQLLYILLKCINMAEIRFRIVQIHWILTKITLRVHKCSFDEFFLGFLGLRIRCHSVPKKTVHSSKYWLGLLIYIRYFVHVYRIALRFRYYSLMWCRRELSQRVKLDLRILFIILLLDHLLLRFYHLQ